MSIPQSKYADFAEFSNQLTKSVLTFIDEKVPEISASDIDLMFTAISYSVREQLVNRSKI